MSEVEKSNNNNKEVRKSNSGSKNDDYSSVRSASMMRKKDSAVEMIECRLITYTSIHILMPATSEEGKILAARITGTCAKKQRCLKRASKRARNLGLMPITKKY